MSPALRAAFATGSGLVATGLLGLMAGFFFAFAADVAPAMTHLDASGYVTTQQWINRAVRNALFAGVYFGAVALPFVAAASAAWAARHGAATAWLLIAAAYFGAVFWVTRSVNVPINEALAGWNPASPPADWAQARDAWNRSNAWRAWGSALCFAAALVVVGAGGPRRAAGP